MKLISDLRKKGILSKLAVAVLDCLIILAAGGFAFFLRFEFSIEAIPKNHLEDWFAFIPLQVVITLIVFVLMRMYRFVWDSVSANDFARMVVAALTANVLSYIMQLALKVVVPRSVVFMSLCFQMAGFVMIRFVVRIYNGIRHRMGRVNDDETVNVMIIGAGQAGRMLIREYQNSERIKADVRCLIDDDRSMWGSYIEGVKIVGGREEIPHYAKSENIDQIIFAIPTADARTQKETLDICKGTGCRLKKVPGIYQIISGEVSLETVKDIQVEDLLGRAPVDLSNESMRLFIKDKTVMVTGGGGSIGAELCRQIARLKPKQLIILDIYENNAYEIQQELVRAYGDKLDLAVEIASVRDKEKTYEIFDKYRSDVVFHAAAHKHVPLMEACPAEAIKNNIFGTWHVMRAAERCGTKKFVEISTDKAVNPTNVMGATKRFCEMMVMCKKNSPTEFCAVRFGNVLGSHGSVVPLFKKQIEEGGPVTVTDKRIIRYFMTIPEAAQLVLEAGSMAKRNQIYVLDMGEPVKILELAENLIRLSGLQPYRDIDIVEIGLRPGEKLYEELLMSSKTLVETDNKKIFVEEQEDIPEAEIMAELENLDKAVTAGVSDPELVELLHRIVPTFREAEEYNAATQ
ncbi:MAG TPA: nucleoside-diphosphate sugar epimerase/dehydratase [Bacillota bacterium]|nr:nucleoside-diphosphate sugar epimerase/dehydratase [Bacillota bacterium]